jgi:hypothetical protein
MHRQLLDCFRRFLSYLGTDTLRVDDRVVGRAGQEWLDPSA